MAPRSQPFPIVVLGRVAVRFVDARSQQPLSRAKRRIVAALVAAGPRGITAEDLDDGSRGTTQRAALRVAMARLREHLPDGALPPSVDGRYVLDLPEGAVDAWALVRAARNPLPDDADADEVTHLLDTGRPYGGITGSTLIVRSGEELQHAQLRLIRRIADERPDLLRVDVVNALRQHLERDPLNEHLVLLTALALARAGERRGAITAIARARKELADSGLSLSAPLEQLEHALLEGALDLEIDLPPVQSGGVALPEPLQDQLSGRYLGPTGAFDAIVERLDQYSRRVVSATVSGPSGVGKTRLCAEVARQAGDRGFAVVYAAAGPAVEGAALGPFLAALPGLRTAIERIGRQRLDAESRAAVMRVAATGALIEEAAGRPLLIVIDDAQWLDTRSTELVNHLSVSVVDHRVVLLVAGRDDDASAGAWLGLREVLVGGGAVGAELMPLPEDALSELVEEIRPHLTHQQARGLARDLAIVARGLPGVAKHVISSLTDDVAVLPTIDELATGDPLGTVVRSLSAAARRVGLVASVVGPDVDLTTLVAMCELTEDEVLDGVTELVQRQLLIERSTVEFSVAHVLVQAAFVGAELKVRVAQVHRRATERLPLDIHRRARHEAAAVPLVPAAQARASLLASAAACLESGLHREAVVAYRQALTVSVDHLDPRAGGSYARALDLSGARTEARRVRQEAFDRALSVGDHAGALRIAVSGLPESEEMDGDGAIVEHLHRLDPDALPDEERWSRVQHLARQLAILGDVDGAARAAKVAADLSTSPSQRVRAALGRRFTMSATAPASERLAVLEGATGDVERIGGTELAEHRLLMALDLYEAGAHEQAHSRCAELVAIGTDLPPLRRWHGLLMTAMLRTDAGAMAEARSVRRAAYDFGLTCGFAEHANAFLAAEFVDLWLRGSTSVLVGEVGSGVLDPERSMLTRAGAAIVLAEVGVTDDAVAHAVAVARSVLASPIAHGTAALALVCEVLARSEDDELVARVRSMLSGRGDSLIVLGAGAAGLGPGARYLARLERAPEARRHHLLAARQLAERTGSILWRAVALRDLATLDGDATARQELAELVAGSELSDLALD